MFVSDPPRDPLTNVQMSTFSTKNNCLFDANVQITSFKQTVIGLFGCIHIIHEHISKPKMKMFILCLFIQFVASAEALHFSFAHKFQSWLVFGANKWEKKCFSPQPKRKREEEKKCYWPEIKWFHFGIYAIKWCMPVKNLAIFTLNRVNFPLNALEVYVCNALYLDVVCWCWHWLWIFSQCNAE